MRVSTIYIGLPSSSLARTARPQLTQLRTPTEPSPEFPNVSTSFTAITTNQRSMKLFTSCYRPQGPPVSQEVEATAIVATNTTNALLLFPERYSKHNRLTARSKSSSNANLVATNTHVAFSLRSYKRNRRVPRSKFGYVKHWRPTLSVISEDAANCEQVSEKTSNSIPRSLTKSNRLTHRDELRYGKSIELNLK